jgi:hypothetical protein
MVKIISFKRSDNPDKKYMVVLETNEGGRKTIHFGDSQSKDFTLHSPLERESRKKAYISRHKSNEDWNDPLTAGFWSKHILWNLPTVTGSLEATKRRFNL